MFPKIEQKLNNRNEIINVVDVSEEQLELNEKSLKILNRHDVKKILENLIIGFCKKYNYNLINNKLSYIIKFNLNDNVPKPNFSNIIKEQEYYEELYKKELNSLDEYILENFYNEIENVLNIKSDESLLYTMNNLVFDSYTLNKNEYILLFND